MNNRRRAAIVCLFVASGCSTTPEVAFTEDGGSDASIVVQDGSTMPLPDASDGGTTATQDGAPSDAARDVVGSDSPAPSDAGIDGRGCPSDAAPAPITRCCNAVPCVGKNLNDCNNKCNECEQTCADAGACCLNNGGNVDSCRASPALCP
jgi:hypothetical protein